MGRMDKQRNTCATRDVVGCGDWQAFKGSGRRAAPPFSSWEMILTACAQGGGGQPAEGVDAGEECAICQVCGIRDIDKS